MPLYLSESQSTMWAFTPNISAEQNIAQALTKMAIFRQAKIENPETLEMYVSYLLPRDLRAFQVAMAMLSEESRQEGEPAFPSMGMILEAMEEAREIFPNFKMHCLRCQGKSDEPHTCSGAKVNTQPVFAEKTNLKLVSGNEQR